MKAILKTTILTLIFTFTVSFGMSHAEETIHWLKFSELDQCREKDCNLLKSYVSNNFEEVYDLVKADLTKIEPKAIFTSYDFNNDKRNDYIITVSSSIHCGTAGCLSYLILSRDDGYTKIQLPLTYSFQAENTVGVSPLGEIILSGRDDVCGYWKLGKNKVNHLKNSGTCK